MAKKRKLPRLSIVIPTLNEERNLPRVFEDISKSVKEKDCEIIVVDGHSRDGTVSFARKKGARIIYDSIGKGAAIKKGLEASRGRTIVIMDADFSHSAEEINRMVERIEKRGFDVVMGSRFIQGGGSGDITVLRFLGNKLFVFLVNLIWGTKYTDLCYGYRAFSRKAARTLSPKLASGGFGIETEISILAAKERMKICEVPSYEKLRLHGEGNLRTFRDGFIILRTIAKEAFSR